MPVPPPPRRSRGRLYAASAITFFTGMAGAAFLFLTAAPAEDTNLVEDYLHSKAYVHELKARGGSVAVIADELFRWFGGLWQGKSLAVIVAATTACFAFLLFRLARTR